MDQLDQRIGEMTSGATDLGNRLTGVWHCQPQRIDCAVGLNLVDEEFWPDRYYLI